MADSWDIKPLTAAQSPAILAALDYWRSKCGATGLPSRAQIDPLEMRGFLAKILLIEVESADDFIYRLCGTDIVAGNQQDLTGQRADQASLGQSAPHFIEAYRHCVRAREPLFFVGYMWWQDRDHVAFEQIMLPLSSDGRAVDKLLCVVDFDVTQ